MDGEKPTKLTFALLLLAAAAALPLAALDVGNDKLVEHFGVRVAAAEGNVTLRVGQAVTGSVVLSETLARHGLKGIAKGDAMRITLLEGSKMKLQHVSSGRQITVLFSEQDLSASGRVS